MAEQNFNWQGKWVLITGASSGIGRSFADELAAKKANLILVARRGELLEKMADKFVERYQNRVEVIVQDLSEPDAAEKVVNEIEKRRLLVDVLINNAGIGLSGKLTDIEVSATEGLINLNILTLVKLTRLILPQMIERNAGNILNVGSMIGFMPVPTFASYSASKAFVISFSRALAYELRKTNVKVSVLNPGGTMTEFFQSSGYSLKSMGKLVMMSPDAVALKGVYAIEKGCGSVNVGWMNKVSLFFMHFVPTCIKLPIAYFIAVIGNRK